MSSPARTVSAEAPRRSAATAAGSAVAVRRSRSGAPRVIRCTAAVWSASAAAVRRAVSPSSVVKTRSRFSSWGSAGRWAEASASPASEPSRRRWTICGSVTFTRCAVSPVLRVIRSRSAACSSWAARLAAASRSVSTAATTESARTHRTPAAAVPSTHERASSGAAPTAAPPARATTRPATGAVQGGRRFDARRGRTAAGVVIARIPQTVCGGGRPAAETPCGDGPRKVDGDVPLGRGHGNHGT